MVMKRVIVFIMFVLSSLGVQAQEDLTPLKCLEKADSTSGGVVYINNRTSIPIVRAENTLTTAYRMRLYFDNVQNARYLSAKTSSTFQELYPDVKVDVEYKVPYFMVTAGYYLSYMEALIMLTKVHIDFPKTFIIPVEVPLEMFSPTSEFIKKGALEKEILDAMEI